MALARAKPSGPISFRVGVLRALESLDEHSIVAMIRAITSNADKFPTGVVYDEVIQRDRFYRLRIFECSTRQDIGHRFTVKLEMRNADVCIANEFDNDEAWQYDNGNMNIVVAQSRRKKSLGELFWFLLSRPEYLLSEFIAHTGSRGPKIYTRNALNGIYSFKLSYP